MTRPRENVELKARLRSLEQARRIAADLENGGFEIQHQTDTYFHCPQGRLKLREIAGQPAQLISYDRPNHRDARSSRYDLVYITDATGLKRALSSALGIRQVVVKEREIYLHDNVRIHLDQVAGLGTFIEFEAVLTAAPESPADSNLDSNPDRAAERAAGQRRIDELTTAFGISTADLLSTSYGEMLASQTASE